MVQTRRMLTGLPIAAAVALALAGCGSESTGDASGEPTDVVTTTPTPISATPTTTPTPKPLPKCGEVWDAAKLPAGYVGCKKDGKPVTRKLHCSTGQLLYIYADRQFGIPGAKIFTAEGPLEADKQFTKMHRVCSA